MSLVDEIMRTARIHQEAAISAYDAGDQTGNSNRALRRLIGRVEKALFDLGEIPARSEDGGALARAETELFAALTEARKAL